MDTPKITAEEVGMVKRAKAGDQSAFTCIFNRYKPLVEEVLFSYLKDSDEARDITNVVFMKVYEKLSTFTAYNSFGGWLRTIANNTAVDYLRAQKKQNISLDARENVISTEDRRYSTEDRIVDHMTYNQVIKLFDDLPELKKEICLMYYQDRLTVEKISKILKVPTGTIKSVLSRTRKKIKQTLNI